ncbi:MAG: hypothetical protein E5Y60_08440 [Mesorhizobium sp.]|nr:MAG: hypothetical protein E5Y60_08440 [Mesorhizobium sp.]
MWRFRDDRVQPMRLTVIGQLAGLVSGAYFADFGDEVECVGLDDKGIDALRGSEMPKSIFFFCA